MKLNKIEGMPDPLYLVEERSETQNESGEFEWTLREKYPSYDDAAVIVRRTRKGVLRIVEYKVVAVSG